MDFTHTFLFCIGFILGGAITYLMMKENDSDDDNPLS